MEPGSGYTPDALGRLCEQRTSRLQSSSLCKNLLRVPLCPSCFGGLSTAAFSCSGSLGTRIKDLQLPLTVVGRWSLFSHVSYQCIRKHVISIPPRSPAHHPAECAALYSLMLPHCLAVPRCQADL